MARAFPPAAPIRRLALLLAAAVPAAAATAQTNRPAAPLLTREDAAARAARIAEVAYDLELEIGAESPEFSGSIETAFELSGAGTDLTVDFVGGSVAGVVVNGTRVESDYNGYYVTLPARALVEGENTVEIEFAHPYSTDGAGLYRTRDSEDGRVYMYTQFEPYDHNRMFPSFDQPNLKATYSSEITAPAGWTVLSVVREAEVRDAGERRVWSFPESALIPPYIYALHAGPYREWTSTAGDIPLRLFARRSLAEYVEPETWFELTRQGFTFFEDYFGVPYPFGKYDQVIVPHFNFGAMENLGAVTFSEQFIRRGAYTRSDRRSIASVIMHEMAHMWFGNLVTMDWWNGLWLNESFATFMANLALVEATEFSEARESSYRSTVEAYRADERDTTHPIDVPVPDTENVFTILDAITYEKGSAVLKQLNYLVGPETFREGVSRYLMEHAYGNTSLADFLDSISDAAGMDLDPWAENWLETPGTNSVEVELECTNERMTRLRLAQGAPDAYPVLRTHRTQIGLYNFTADSVDVRTVPVTYSGALTVAEIPDDDRCPDLVYANHGDWDYASVRLDPAQLSVLDAHLGKFDDALTRSMLWQSTWDIVLDARMPLPRYIEFALAHAGAEPDDAVFAQVLASLQSALGYVIRLDRGEDLLASIAPRIEGFLWQQARLSTPGSDRQLMLFDRFVAAATSEPAVQQLAALFTGDVALPDGIELDQDRRWNVLAQLSEHGHAMAPQWIQAEAVRDGSELGRLRALGAGAAAPDPAAKRERVEELLAPANDTTLAEARAVAGGLFPVTQHALLAELTEPILAGLERLSGERSSQYTGALARGLLAPVCRPSYLRLLEDALAEPGWMPPTVERRIRVTRFETARCIEIGAQLESAN